MNSYKDSYSYNTPFEGKQQIFEHSLLHSLYVKRQPPCPRQPLHLLFSVLSMTNDWNFQGFVFESRDFGIEVKEEVIVTRDEEACLNVHILCSSQRIFDIYQFMKEFIVQFSLSISKRFIGQYWSSVVEQQKFRDFSDVA